MALDSPTFTSAALVPVANLTDPANHGFGAAVRSIFKRCVECPNNDLTCPPCTSTESCVQVAGGCNTCAQTKCVPTGQSGGTVQNTPAPSSGPNVGAIAGGVAGGVVALAIVTLAVWWFCIRGSRDDRDYPEEEKENRYTARTQSDYSPRTDTTMARRNSTRSMASTVMTRASNVIQIAFIPGITDRSGHGHDEDVPPVPHIPSGQFSPASYHDHTSETSIPMTPYRDRSPGPGTPHSVAESQDHYFMPQDLQHSRFSTFSDETDTIADGRSTRYRSMASITPSLARQSIASTIRHDPMPSMPAQMVTRGRANVVSVKTPGSSTPPAATPPMPSMPKNANMDYFKYGDAKRSQSQTRPMPRAVSTMSRESASTSASGPSERSNQVAAAISEATRRASARPAHAGLGGLNAGSGRGSSPRGPPRPREGSPLSSRVRDASPATASSRTRSPMSGRPGTGHGRDVSPFSDKNAATPP